jgi:2-amino-4-hydroxy-6-hydroxymethyldihydropteridine diphosphokinase
MEALAYIGIGSNLQQPLQQVKTAISRFRTATEVTVCDVSKLYITPALGPPNQPDYINAVVKLSTRLSATELLSFLQQIEHEQGRVRSDEQWSARTLDLDLLLYGDDVIQTTDLTVPHPAITARAFVLYPLQDVAPNLLIPNNGTISNIIKALSEARPKIITDATLEFP